MQKIIMLVRTVSNSAFIGHLFLHLVPACLNRTILHENQTFEKPI